MTTILQWISSLACWNVSLGCPTTKPLRRCIAPTMRGKLSAAPTRAKKPRRKWRMSSRLLPSTNTRSNAFLSKRANAFRFLVIRARRAELRMTNATKNAQADFLILRTDDWQINHRTDTALPGYLIVGTRKPISELYGMPQKAL